MNDQYGPYTVGLKNDVGNANFSQVFETYKAAYEFAVQVHGLAPFVTYFILDSKGNTYYPTETRGE